MNTKTDFPILSSYPGLDRQENVLQYTQILDRILMTKIFFKLLKHKKKWAETENDQNDKTSFIILYHVSQAGLDFCRGSETPPMQ